METDRNKLVKWLNKLQKESWQLELIVSGFAIFLMLGAMTELRGAHEYLSLISQGVGNVGQIITIGYAILLGACFFILINLVLHLFLRGIWISTIGLRYVSGDIDFDSLKLSPKFDRLLRRKIGSFDDYILGLENICSLVFSFTFLIVFMLIALGMYLGFIALVVNVLTEFIGVPTNWVAIPLLVIFMLCGLLYFIDFLTLGYIKRIKWLSHFYVPVYRLFSFITLSFLYRPIYYNLIDNKIGRRVGFLLVPYVVIIGMAFSEKVHSHVWYPERPGKHSLLNTMYDDQRADDQLVTKGSIASKFVGNGFLQLFIAYHPSIDNIRLKQLCPNYTPEYESGIESDLVFSVNGVQQARRVPSPDSALTCFSNLYKVFLDDSLYAEPKYRFYRQPKLGEYGVVAMLDVGQLGRGEHNVRVRKVGREKEDGPKVSEFVPFFDIPFWIE